MSDPFTSFSFHANTDKPDDLSGVATFWIPGGDGGEVQAFTTDKLDSNEAWALHLFIQQAFAVGKSYGYRGCKDKVLSAL